MIFNVGILCLVFSIKITCASLDELYTWKYVDYVWDTPQHKSDAIDNGTYNVSMNIPYDVDQAPDGRIFVTVVRDVGVPTTLTIVSNKTGEGGPLLRPYPDWSWYDSSKGCTGITGVYRIAIDRCNRLWVLDCGKIGQDQVCPAQLLAFDLSTDKLMKRIIIPSEYATNKNGTGLLVTPIVDTVGRDCRKTNVYMADTEGYGMVIWDGERLFRIESKYFDPEKGATRFAIAGQTFNLSDGLLGMSIEPGPRQYSQRRLYFRPLASFHMSYTKIADLHSLKDEQSKIRYRTKSHKLRSQSAAQAFSKNGILFYSSTSDRSMICWNRRRRFNTKNNVQFAINNETLQFASGVKVVNNYYSENLFVMTNRYQRVANGDVDFTDTNFRILKGNVNKLVKGTRCE